MMMLFVQVVDLVVVQRVVFVDVQMVDLLVV